MMSMRNAVMGSRAGVFAVCAVALVIMAGCGMFQVASTWRDREVVINGNDEGYEWSHAKHFFDEEMLTIGVLNDGDYLYLRLSTPSPTLQQQVRRQGLTLWFDPTGGKEKTEGIKYPRGTQAVIPAAGGNRTQAAGPVVGLGGDAPAPQQPSGGGGMMMGGRAMPGGAGGGAMPGAGGGGMPGAGGGGMMNRQQATTNEELDLIGFGNTEVRTLGLGLIEPLGVEVSMNTIDDVLIYEMKIPLTAKQAEWCAIGVDSGSFSLGIEVPKAAGTQSAPAAPAGGGGGGRGGAGGAGGGGRGGAGGGGMGAAPAGGGGAPRATASSPTATPENVELWLKVQLATAP